jgi:hypothetical protein
MKKILVVTALALAMSGLGVEAGWVLRESTNGTKVSCPTEDSCTPDYHHGSWTIVPVTP